jgi:hypothetical protein
VRAIAAYKAARLENSSVLTPEPPTPVVPPASSAAMPGWLTERNHGPWGDAPASQISPLALAEA